MTDSQMGWMYFWTALLVVLMFVFLEGLQRPQPSTAQEYAQALCKELYGPQTGAVWIENSLKCESARGEIVEIRNPANH